MTTSVAAQVALATVDDKGCLLHADPRLEQLNRRAGGDIGRPFAVPQLAVLVRLARRLRIGLSRRIIAADEEGDVELHVHVEPEGDAWQVSVAGWDLCEAWQDEHDEAPDHRFDVDAADWLWETDAALRITALAREDGARFGFDADSMLGKPLTDLFLFFDDAGDFPILNALAGQCGFQDQSARLRVSGREVSLSAIARRDSMGRFGGFEGWTIEPRGCELPDDDAQQQPESVSVGSAFGVRLERALRGPLGRIIANADSIRAGGEAELSPEYADYAGDIASAGRHLMGLVEDLVDLQTIESDDFETESETLDLVDIARRAAGLLKLRAQQADSVIDTPKSGESLPAIGEFRRVLQILVNLIGNAVRYSPAGGTIWVRASRDANRACLIVADQGKGIAEADQARIFEKFERIDSTESGGSGLGLYIARRLARAMGGDIVVDSAPGEGARFIFWLPASVDADEQAKATGR
ncbi:MAG: PAS domain-containing sensor histidine kinase [Sphingomonas sp.]|nr:PAS domain-containing sensor histidine kinase [Sphingomonas sp.]